MTDISRQNLLRANVWFASLYSFYCAWGAFGGTSLAPQSLKERDMPIASMDLARTQARGDSHFKLLKCSLGFCYHREESSLVWLVDVLNSVVCHNHKAQSKAWDAELWLAWQPLPSAEHLWLLGRDPQDEACWLQTSSHRRDKGWGRSLDPKSLSWLYGTPL